jgi:hypothetical protein
LHAESLGFVHPTTGLPLRFVAQWPQEFRDCQRGVSSHRKGGKEGRFDRSDRESQGD